MILKDQDLKQTRTHETVLATRRGINFYRIWFGCGVYP